MYKSYKIVEDYKNKLLCKYKEKNIPRDVAAVGLAGGAGYLGYKGGKRVIRTFPKQFKSLGDIFDINEKPVSTKWIRDRIKREGIKNVDFHRDVVSASLRPRKGSILNNPDVVNTLHARHQMGGTVYGAVVLPDPGINRVHIILPPGSGKTFAIHEIGHLKDKQLRAAYKSKLSSVVTQVKDVVSPKRVFNREIRAWKLGPTGKERKVLGHRKLRRIALGSYKNKIRMTGGFRMLGGAGVLGGAALATALWRRNKQKKFNKLNKALNVLEKRLDRMGK